jgi:hypothetical protein
MVVRNLAWALICISLQLHAHQPIIYCVSTPRSLSTAFLRMMESRGDFAIFHEPTVRLYTDVYYPDLTQNWFLVDKEFEQYGDVTDAILAAAQTSNVFIKDMHFSSLHYCMGDNRLLLDEQCQFIFLIRDPHDCLISYYKKLPDISTMQQVMSFKILYDLYQLITTHNPNKVIILKSEDIAADAEDTIRNLCQQLSIPFFAHSLQWDDLGEAFDGVSQWHETKEQKITHHWHSDAIHSTQFTTCSHYEVDAHGSPTFSEIKNEEDRLTYIKAYEENMMYYKKLLSIAT